MGVRGCPFCGKSISDQFRECPFCHENLPEVKVGARVVPASEGSSKIRRGLMYMFVVIVLYYIFSGDSPIKVPMPFAPFLTNYLLPIFFVAALGMTVYGLYLRYR